MKGFDTRIADYEYIHSIKPIQFVKLNQAISPKTGQCVLDAAAGYGSVTKRLHDYCQKKNLDVAYFLIEESRVQLDRAKAYLPWMQKKNMILGSILSTPFPKNFFDTVVIKMGLHEIPKAKQQHVFKEAYRILKPGGKLVIWDLALSKEDQRIFQDIINEKDRLAGYKLLVRDRYFGRTDEILTSYAKHKFHHAKIHYSFTYRFSTKLRLEQEFGGDRSKLSALNAFIQKRVPEKLQKKMRLSASKDSVLIDVPKKIFIGWK